MKEPKKGKQLNFYSFVPELFMVKSYVPITNKGSIPALNAQGKYSIYFERFIFFLEKAILEAASWSWSVLSFALEKRAVEEQPTWHQMFQATLSSYAVY